MRDSEVIHHYSNEQALEDGVLVDVTPNSFREKGRVRVWVTPSIKKDYSMAAIMEMYNSFANRFNSHVRNPDKEQWDCFTIEKMNGNSIYVYGEVWNNGLVIKMFYPHER